MENITHDYGVNKLLGGKSDTSKTYKAPDDANYDDENDASFLRYTCVA